MVTDIKFKRVTALPFNLQPNTLYFVKPNGAQSVSLFITGTDGIALPVTGGTPTPTPTPAPTPTPTPTPTLSVLTVFPTSATIGTAYTGTVTGKTAGSALSLSGTGAAGLSVVGVAISGTPTTAGAVNIIETLAGATNTPRTSSGIVTVQAAAPTALSAPQLTQTSAANASPLTFDTLLPDNIDHTTNKVRGQRAANSGFTTDLVTEVIQLDENMIEGQSLPFNFLVPPYPTGANYVRVREENADGSVVSPWSNVLLNTFAAAVNNGFNSPSPLYTLTQGNKIATRDTSATSGIARAPVGITSGVGRYFEITFNYTSGYAMIGLTSDATLAGDGETSGTDRVAFKSDQGFFKDGNFIGGSGGPFTNGQTAGFYYYPDTDEVYHTDGGGGTRGPFTWSKAIAMYPFGFVSTAGSSMTINLTGPFLRNERGATAWNA